MSESVRYTALIYDTFLDMQNDPNIHAGTNVITLGDTLRGDGKGGLYKICNSSEIRTTDTVYPLHGKKSHLSAVYINTTFKGKKPEGETPDLDELIALIGQLEEDVDDISTTQRRQTSTISTLSSKTNTLDNKVNILTDNMSSVNDQLQSHTESISTVNQDVQTLKDSVSTDISALNSRVTNVNTDLNDRINDVQDSLHSEIQNVYAFRTLDVLENGTVYIRGNQTSDQKYLIFSKNDQGELPAIDETITIELDGTNEWIVPVAMSYSNYAVKDVVVNDGLIFHYSSGDEEEEDPETPEDQGSLENPYVITTLDHNTMTMYDENEEEIIPQEGCYYILFGEDPAVDPDTIYFYDGSELSIYAIVPHENAPGSLENPVQIASINLEENKIYDGLGEEMEANSGYYYVLRGETEEDPDTIYYFDGDQFSVYEPSPTLNDATPGSLENPIPIASINLEENKIYDENEEEIIPEIGFYYVLTEGAGEIIYYYDGSRFIEYFPPYQGPTLQIEIHTEQLTGSALYVNPYL